MKFVTTDEINSNLSFILSSPKDVGKIESIIVRRRKNERELRKEVFLSPEKGVEGDRWYDLSKGKPDPRRQLTIINSRLIKLLAQSVERMQLAGDNLIIDLDISDANLPVGQRLTIGKVMVEITDVPHTGCSRFAERYGNDAVEFINAPERSSLRLRGVYAKFLNSGLIHVGDIIKKI